MMEQRNILIAGATGSWGTALLERLLETEAAQIRVLARNEYQMVCLRRRFEDPRVRVVLGDIRDRVALLRACEGIDVLFHLAAMKHVTMCEQMPEEAIATNVLGTQNLVDCAIRCKVEKVVYTSTDKAVTPHCTYGCTKLLGEKLVLAGNERAADTQFIVFRSGNLLGSSGSVLPLFEQQIERSGRVSLTDRRMSRFFIPIAQAAELLLESATRGAGGEVFLPRMDALSIEDIARYLLRKHGLEENRVEITGMRPGEKLSEAMATEEECRTLYQVGDQLCAVIGPDSRSRMTNGLAAAEDYKARSEEAVLERGQADAFLQSAGI